MTRQAIERIYNRISCDTVDNYKYGALLSAAILLVVVLLQLTIPDFIIEGSPLEGMYWSILFLFISTILSWVKLLRLCGGSND